MASPAADARGLSLLHGSSLNLLPFEMIFMTIISLRSSLQRSSAPSVPSRRRLHDERLPMFLRYRGLLVLAYRGYMKGEIRAGSSGLKPYTPTREDNPLAFHFFITLYLFGGCTLLIWALLMLAGVAKPSPLS